MGPKIDRLRRLIYLALALALAPSVARAALPDQCGRARDRAFAADTAKDIASGTVLFVCYGHYVYGMKVLLTPGDGGDFMLTVVVEGHVYSALIFGKQVERLRAQSGNYVLNSDKSCFIRGKLTKPAILHFGGEKELPGDPYFAARDSLDYIDCDAPK
jgi:hypothetical protein